MKNQVSKEQTSRLSRPELEQCSLLSLLRRIQREYAMRIQRWGLPMHVAGTLLEIHLHPETAEPSHLADGDGAGVPRQTMTFILDSLERRALAKRMAHPVDRRRKIIRLTPKGSKLAQQIYEDILEFEAHGLEVVPSCEAPVMRERITRYIEALIEQNKVMKRPSKPKE
ncbi:MAG: hypothetical protein LBN38_01420 [Verrucomicrobiota bacterium]|jgi:DNA-binding MarR family transcriptional regulator|nr:hypothetical protein [Verrucomicrobiota bacterium]